VANQRLYRRSEAGTAAWQRQDAGVPVEYRRVLGLVEGDMHPDTLRARFPRLSPEATARLLDELVERGLLEAVEALEQHDFDFTNTLNLADLQKAAG
jgi:hypothetical protein